MQWLQMFLMKINFLCCTVNAKIIRGGIGKYSLYFRNFLFVNQFECFFFNMVTQFILYTMHYSFLKYCAYPFSHTSPNEWLVEQTHYRRKLVVVVDTRIKWHFIVRVEVLTFKVLFHLWKNEKDARSGLYDVCGITSSNLNQLSSCLRWVCPTSTAKVSHGIITFQSSLVNT